MEVQTQVHWVWKPIVGKYRSCKCEDLRSRYYFLQTFINSLYVLCCQLLIPTVSVINVTKEKTAFILPNAVGVVTADDRHVFSSLLSRDTTYRLMVQVWRTVHAVTALGAIVSRQLSRFLCQQLLTRPVSVKYFKYV